MPCTCRRAKAFSPRSAACGRERAAPEPRRGSEAARPGLPAAGPTEPPAANGSAQGGSWADRLKGPQAAQSQAPSGQPGTAPADESPTAGPVPSEAFPQGPPQSPPEPPGGNPWPTEELEDPQPAGQGPEAHHASQNGGPAGPRLSLDLEDGEAAWVPPQDPWSNNPYSQSDRYVCAYPVCTVDSIGGYTAGLDILQRHAPVLLDLCLSNPAPPVARSLQPCCNG